MTFREGGMVVESHSFFALDVRPSNILLLFLQGEEEESTVMLL